MTTWLLTIVAKWLLAFVSMIVTVFAVVFPILLVSLIIAVILCGSTNKEFDSEVKE